MIEWKEVGAGAQGLRVHRIDAQPEGQLLPGGGGFDPLRVVLQEFPNPTTLSVEARFTASGPPVGASSLRVACHAVSLPDSLLVVDSTFRTTAVDVFPAVLEAIVASEGRRLGERPVRVIYTHAHFDHAGGREAVEALGPNVEIQTHRHTEALFPLLSRRESFFRTRSWFFRDCGIEAGLPEFIALMRERFMETLAAQNLDLSDHPFPETESPLRVDTPIGLEPHGALPMLDGRVEVLRFDGHIPGHLCVLVDRKHFISGDMWLPATTSTITPAPIAALAGVPAEACGVVRYIESDEALLARDVDGCISYPSHENVFVNPKRMAMRDLVLFAERLALVYRVLGEHRRQPMRVLDLAWGGGEALPVWKLAESRYRLAMAHDEACAYVHDLVALGDLREVEPERYVWTGRKGLERRLHAVLDAAQARFGRLEFRDRGR